jgi:replication factor C subunit 1
MEYNNNNLWADKYRPKQISDLIGNDKNIKRVVQWIKKFKKGKTEYRALFLYGPPGIGKTTIAHIILKKFGYEIIEFNASDVRSQKSVRENISKFLDTINVSFINSKVIKPMGIIMDEVDGMSSGDRGGVSELVKLIAPKKKVSGQKFFNPVICICNNNSEKKLSDLKKFSLQIKFNKPSLFDLNKVAKNIISKEKINIDDDAVQILLLYSQHDFRRLSYILQDLKNIYSEENITTEKLERFYESFSKKNIDTNLFEATHKIINNYNNLQDNLNLYKSEKSLLSMMIHENFINHIKNSKMTKIQKLETSFEIIHSLSTGDIIDKYIYNNQFWELQEYNGIIKCCYPSYIISKGEKKKNNINNRVLFTTLLSKSALHFGNQKNMSLLKNKFKMNGKYIFYLQKYILDNIFKEKIDSTFLDLLKRYDINSVIIDKLVKIDKFDKENNFRKSYSNKKKNYIKSLLD